MVVRVCIIVCFNRFSEMSVLHGCSYLLQLKDNGVWNAF